MSRLRKNSGGGNRELGIGCELVVGGGVPEKVTQRKGSRFTYEVEWETPEQSLAFDEWLVEQCENGGPEVLYFWGPQKVFVVVGYGNRVEEEVHRGNCERDGVPILRRVSGGGTVLQMPGCLNYSLILRVPESGPLSTITGANQFIMQRHADALSHLLEKKVEVRGITDLVMEGRKCSGNAQRRYRNVLLFHGVFLLDAELELMERYLRFPPRAPDYRAGRSHLDFVTNLKISPKLIKEALRESWQAEEECITVTPQDLEPIAHKYTLKEWNYRH